MKRTMHIGKNRTITFDDGDGKKVYESLEEWKAEGERRFGENIFKWKFKCPMCGHVASVEDFKAAGAKDPANSAYKECLGRYTGKREPREGDSSGCNWAAYGFLGIPKGGVYVFTGPEQGAHIFDFAEESGV